MRHAAAKLAMRPSQSVTAFVAELEGPGPTVVLGDDRRSVDDALATAYDLLTPDAARLFERLGLVAGEFCLHLAAAAAGTTGHRVRILLDELVGAHLVVEGRSGEFSYHHVVGRFARRLASLQEWTSAGWGAGDCPECRLAHTPRRSLRCRLSSRCRSDAALVGPPSWTQGRNRWATASQTASPRSWLPSCLVTYAAP